MSIVLTPRDGEIISPRILPPGSSNVDDCNVIPTTQATETSEDSKEQASPPPYATGMSDKIIFYSTNTLKSFKNLVDKMDSSPVQATASFHRPPTPIPRRRQHLTELSSSRMAIEESSQSANRAQVYFTQIHSPTVSETPLKHTVSLPALNKDAKLPQDQDLDPRIRRKNLEFVREDPELEEPSKHELWQVDTSTNTPTLRLDLRLSQDPDVYASTSSDSEQDSSPGTSLFQGSKRQPAISHP